MIRPMSDTEPTFAVIMPVYNHADYVAEAIESVLGQTFGDWRLWIVDDGSTDDSGRVAERYAAGDRRIHVLRQANAGPAAARNRAVAASCGDWLAFLDSDDVYYPTALADFAEFIASHPQVRFIYGYRHRLNSDGSVTELAGEFQDRPTGTAELFSRMYLSHLCVCYRRELFDAVGGYDQRLRSVEDYDLYLRMSLHTRFVPMGKPTGLRRRHASNISRQTGQTRSLQAAVLERFLEHYGGKKLLDGGLVARRMGRIYYAAGRQYFKQRRWGCSAAALRKSLGYALRFKPLALLTVAETVRGLKREPVGDLPTLQ